MPTCKVKATGTGVYLLEAEIYPDQDWGIKCMVVKPYHLSGEC